MDILPILQEKEKKCRCAMGPDSLNGENCLEWHPEINHNMHNNMTEIQCIVLVRTGVMQIIISFCPYPYILLLLQHLMIDKPTISKYRPK